MLVAAWKSPALRVTAAFAVTGAAYTVGNLVLARALPKAEFGLVALVASIIALAGPLAPAGLDLLILRRGLKFSRRLAGEIAVSCLGVAAATTVVGWAVYGLGPTMLAILFLGTAGGGASQSVAAQFQSLRLFRRSVPLTQSKSAAILVAAVVASSLPGRGAVLPAGIIAAGYLCAAAVGWLNLPDIAWNSEPTPPTHWGEGLVLLGVNSASLVFVQLERLVLPKTLGLPDLATFGVLAALVGSPFSMLQIGVGYTIMPRLRDARSASERRRLLWREAVVVVATMALAAAVVWALTPLILRWFLHGKYDLSHALIIAAICSGVLKVLGAFATSVVTAVASSRALKQLSLLGWVSVLVGAVGGILGARWGLVGVVYGVGLGWLLRLAIASGLALPHVRSDRS